MLLTATGNLSIVVILPKLLFGSHRKHATYFLTQEYVYEPLLSNGRLHRSSPALLLWYPGAMTQSVNWRGRNLITGIYRNNKLSTFRSYDTDNSENGSSIDVCVFDMLRTYLPSRCLVMTAGMTWRYKDNN
jgi:hypothetical protein